MLLTLVTFLPLVFALIIWMIPKETWIRPVAFALSLVEFLLSFGILKQFKINSAALQMVEQIPWVKSAGISYFVGVDGISLWLVMLSTFLGPIVILGSWNAITEKVKAFHINVFILLSAMIGTFVAVDAILFYIFFEASLIPMYFIVGIWGGTRKIYATFKFVIYTMAGSLLMLVAIIALMILTERQLGEMSASLLDFYRLQIPFIGGKFFAPQTLMFFAFAIAFAIKVPMFPFHTWLPDAHVEAPTPGSVILAAVMLKMGTYGFLRFVIPLFPEATQHFGWIFLLLGVIGIIYGALVAMVQPDIKKLVAYSSVSHMGYVVLGIFAMNVYGVSGSIYQMLNHGVSTGALFLLVGMIYERTHSREISKYGGLALAMPIYTIYFLIITLSSIAVPMTNGFIGEYLILLGTFNKSVLFGALAAIGVVLGAAYMLWMFKRVFFGPAGELVKDSVSEDDGHGHHGSHAKTPAKSGHGHHALLDLSLREQCVLVPLVILVFWMGLLPGHFLKWSDASIQNLVNSPGHYQLVVDKGDGKETSPSGDRASEPAQPETTGEVEE